MLKVETIFLKGLYLDQAPFHQESGTQDYPAYF